MELVKHLQQNTDNQQTILKLTHDLEELETQYKDAKDKAESDAVNELKTTINSLESQLTTAKNIANDLQNSLQTLTTDSQSTIINLQSSHAQTEERLTKQIKLLETKLHGFETRVEEDTMSKEGITSELVNQIAALETQLRVSRIDWEGVEAVLVERCRQSEKEKSLLKTEVLALTNKISELEHELTQLESSKSALEDEKNINAASIIELNTKIKNLNLKIETYHQTIKDVEASSKEQLESLEKTQKQEIESLKQLYESRKELTQVTSPAESAGSPDSRRAMTTTLQHLKQTKSRTVYLESQIQSQTAEIGKR